jgi:FtsH-binding integral membrane protein
MQDFTRPPYPNYSQTHEVALAQEAAFFQKIYFWMCGALVVTALTAYGLASSRAWYSFLTASKFSFLIIFAIQIGLVVAIGSLMRRVAGIVIKALFLAFAVSMGFTCSVVLLVYNPTVIVKALVSTAVVYAAMAVYGLVTKRSLQGWGSFLFMGLVGLIIASLVNFFMASAAMDFVICIVGVLIFAGLTAYDHQKLRVLYATNAAGAYGGEGNLVIYGALQLYLDFINLFLFLVRLFGRE